MAHLWYWLVDVPAAIVSLWIAVYRFVLLVASIALSGTITAMLLLMLFGIRWGW